MKRILLNAAEWRDDLYWYGGTLFAGIGFELFEDLSVKCYEIDGGRIVAPYISICEEDLEVNSRIDLQGASGDYDPILYNGERFAGMGYEFYDGWCCYEGLITAGAVDQYVRWRRNGDMAECSLHGLLVQGNSFGEHYTWHDVGTMESCDIRTSSAFGFSVKFFADGCLRNLILENRVLDLLEEIAIQSRFLPIRHRSELYSLRAGDEALLMGNDIDSNFFEAFAVAGVLAATERLKILETTIGEVSGAAIAAMPALNDLEIESRYFPDQILIARSVKRAKPSMKVTFNQVEIV